MSEGLDPDHDGHFVCPDLGPNCLQKLPAIFGDGGLAVRLGIEGSRVRIPPRQPEFSEQKISPTFAPLHLDRAVFVQVCYFLSAVSRCMLLEKGREIVSLGRLDCRFHKVAQ